MRIGVISDTHGIVPAWQKAVGIFGGAGLILHAGDVLYHPPRLGFTPGYDIPGLASLMNAAPAPIVIARGNCDSEVYEELLEMPVLAPYAVVQVGSLRIVINHGHTLSAEDLRQRADKYGADIFITGHTHLPIMDHIGKAVHLNPGSPSHPKFERDGVPVPTVGLISDGNVQIIALETGEVITETALG